MRQGRKPTTFPWRKTGNKVCFVTAYIGNSETCDINITPSPRMTGCDYLCFTNVTKPRLLYNKNWTIIRIQDLPNFKELHEINHNVRISRYFKFNFKEFLDKYCHNFQNYGVVFWNDCTIYPIKSTIWKRLISLVKKHNSGLIQYNWVSKNIDRICLTDELNLIAKNGKDTKENIMKTKEYLITIDPGVELDKKQYYENTCFGYHLGNTNAQAMFTSFWKHYLNCPTFRDQPLWNFMYLSKNLNPAIESKLKHYYRKGKRKLTKKNYNMKFIIS